MADLALLTSFVRAAEHGSFSAAARSLGVSAAAVSKNVAHLEAHVGVRLFHRSTRRLALTGGGERFLAQVRDPLASLDAAIAGIRDDSDEPSGVLKVSMGQALGRHFLVPLLNEFLDLCPAVVPDWHFDNRRIDLVGEGFDAAVGGGFELAQGLVARELAPVHIVAVAAPAYLAGRPLPQQPADFAGLAGIMRRSTPSAVDAAPAPRRRPAGAVPSPADPQRSRGHLAGRAPGPGRRVGAHAVRVRAHRVRRAGPAAARLVQRRRPAVALLSVAPPVARQDACLRRLRRRTLSSHQLRAPGRRARLAPPCR
jgi:DNA-binding transcriptional LysR family regulator